MNILDKYGIKEVADVTIYEINESNEIGNPVLYLDTLKISTLEFDSEQANYYGGKGNALLTTWDYNKTVLLRLQDALFSMKSLAILCGGKLDNFENKILKTELFIATDTKIPEEGENKSGWTSFFTTNNQKQYLKRTPIFYDEIGNKVNKFIIGEKYYCSYYLNTNGFSIEISESNFPGYYSLVGETYIRSEITGKDELFYFIIPKAKLLSQLTLTMTADDCSVFDFDFEAIQLNNQALIKLVKCKTNISDNEDVSTTSVLGKAILGQLILGEG